MYINDKITIMHSNFQSVKNKIASLKAIVESINNDLMTMNETNLKNIEKFKLGGSKCFTKKSIMPILDIAICVSEKYAAEVIKVSEGTDDEYVIKRHGKFMPSLNIITCIEHKNIEDLLRKLEKAGTEFFKELHILKPRTKLLCWSVILINIVLLQLMLITQNQ